MAPNSSNVVALPAVQQRTATAINHWSSGQLKTIKQTLAADCTPDEFDFFIQYAIAKRLDPILGHLVVLVFGKKDRDKSKRKMKIITTQAGMRALADRCGDYHPAKPGDTQWTLTDYEQERQRLIGEAKTIFNLNDRAARLAEIHANMPPDAANPAGIVECRTVIYKGGEPVEGIADWKEFAPLAPDAQCFETYDTGEVWEDSGKPIRRKRVKAGINLEDHMILDPTGQWPKMPKQMIAKCGNVNSLKAAYPDHFDHNTNTEETIERERVLDLTATELLDMAEHERRQAAVGMSKDEYPWDNGDGQATFVPVGQFGDTVLKAVRACRHRGDFDRLMGMTINRESFNRYWANHKGDALQVKKQWEAVAAKLPDAPAPAQVTIDHDPQEGVPPHA